MVLFFGVLSNFGIKVFANFIKHSEKCYLVFCNKDCFYSIWMTAS